MPAHILIVGKDPRLLRTRAWVLQKAGFEVEPVRQSADLSSHLRRHVTDLVILCHSLSARESNQMLADVRATDPRMRTLVLTEDAGNFREEDRHGVLSAFIGPAALIEKVHVLIGSDAAVVSAVSME